MKMMALENQRLQHELGLMRGCGGGPCGSQSLPLVDKFNEVPCRCMEVVKRLELCLVDRFYKGWSEWG